jgi:hypothetical protein
MRRQDVIAFAIEDQTQLASSSPPPGIGPIKFSSISIGAISAVVKDVREEFFVSRNRAAA